MSKNSTKVDPDNLGSSAFASLAPLLTLFGDEATKQFLATSMTLADSVLLSIAPLGIMTIIVSAIRVGGNRFMKSVIGRARESPDDIEKEILSSTSNNVREVWNGHRIVRQTGELETAILVFDPHQVNNQDKCVRSLCTQQSYEPPQKFSTSKKFKLSEKNLIPGSSQEQAAYLWALDEIGDSHKVSFPNHRLLSDISPNLTTNLQGAVPDRWVVVLLSIIGLLAQAAVMAINALVVYHWKLFRAGKAIADHGYPLWAAGTVCITIGTCICGWVVESSSWKVSLTVAPSKPDAIKPQIIMLQKEISEMKTPMYAITTTQPREPFRISRRVWPPSTDGVQNKLTRREATKRSIMTSIGAFITLSGFVCQNLGTRELHWSAGVIQLGLTIVLTMTRAWLRRHVGNRLGRRSQSGIKKALDRLSKPERSSKPNTIELKPGPSEASLSSAESTSDNPSDLGVIELNPGFESCNLATRLTRHYCYIPSAAGKPPSVLHQSKLDPENKTLGLPSDTRQICWVPMIDQSGIRSLQRGLQYDLIANNILKSQALLASFGSDPENIVALATGCAKAMKECLKVMCTATKKEAPTALYQLSSITHILVANSNPGDGCSKPYAIARARVPQFRAGVSDGDARFIQAIISLTRYTYRDMIIRDSRKLYGMGVWRILGHCRGQDVPFYLSWMSKRNLRDSFSVRRVEKRDPSSVGDSVYLPEDLPNIGHSDRIGVVFGLSFSHVFDVQLSPKRDTDTQDIGSDSNKQSDSRFDIVIQDPEHDRHVDFTEALDRNIVQDLISSFLLQLSREYKQDFTTFLADDEHGEFDKLVNILVKHKVCSSKDEALLAIIPIIIDRKSRIQRVLP